MDDPFDTPSFREAAAGHQQDQERGRVVPIPIPRGGMIVPGAPAHDFKATPFVWQDPATLPRRPWLYGRSLLRQQVSVTVAPGGVGKSSLTIVEGLAMASGRELLSEWTAPGLSVWLFNLEDPHDELQLRITAAMQHHQVRPEDIAGRLYVDSGRDQELCTAIAGRDGAVIVRPVMDALAEELTRRRIDVLVIDPFVSSHRAGENDNNAIDMIAKEWARVATRCNCGIELVHHARKTNGSEVTTEDGRGGSALAAAARSGRVLNRMTAEERKTASIPETDLRTYFAVTRDKANLGPAGKRQWRRVESVELSNGESVGVVEVWDWPDTFDGLGVADLLAVQQAIEGKHPRFSDQSGDAWAGVIVADVLGLDVDADRKRIKLMIDAWMKSGALVKVKIDDDKRRPRPCLEVGEWATE